jgi:hypothetical protein
MDKNLVISEILEKVNKKTEEVTCYLQMLAAAIVNSDFKEVIPLAPECINKQDGQSNNDCERNAARRFFEKLSMHLDRAFGAMHYCAFRYRPENPLPALPLFLRTV